MPPRAKNANNEAEGRENLKVAERIRDVRLLSGYHLKTIAQRIGVTYQIYSRYEQGAPLSFGRLVQIARALDVSVEHLLNRAGGPSEADMAVRHEAMGLARLFLGMTPARRALLQQLAAELSRAPTNGE